MIDSQGNDTSNKTEVSDMFVVEDTGQWIYLKGVIVARVRQKIASMRSLRRHLHSAVFEQTIVGIEHFPGKDQKPFSTQTTIVETTLAIEHDPKSFKDNSIHQMRPLQISENSTSFSTPRRL